MFNILNLTINMSHLQIMASSSSSDEDDICTSSGKSRQKKGPVYMSKLIKKHTLNGTKITVNFDQKKRPIGNDGVVWRSFLGMVARSRVPITYSDWRKVPNHYKETLWREANVSF